MSKSYPTQLSEECDERVQSGFEAAIRALTTAKASLEARKKASKDARYKKKLSQKILRIEGLLTITNDAQFLTYKNI